ncbi:MAG: alpha/beta hydrolase [Myxococcota bacterium]
MHLRAGLLLLTVGSGCASAPLVCRAPKGLGGPPPAVARAPQTAADGTCLQGFLWESPKPPRAVLIVVHGLLDHSTRYDALAHAAGEKGFVVYAQDHRGHGASGGARQRFDSIPELVADVDGLVNAAAQEHPGLPVFMLGHSLGGLVTASYALEHPGKLRGIVLSGPALKLFPEVDALTRTAARFFGTVAPGLPAQDLDEAGFVSTPEARQDFEHDPEIEHQKLPARSALAALEGIEAIQARMGELKLPLLIVHGGRDRITNAAGGQELVERAASADKRIALYEGAFHDLLHEPVRDRVIGDVVAWLDTHAQ